MDNLEIKKDSNKSYGNCVIQKFFDNCDECKNQQKNQCKKVSSKLDYKWKFGKTTIEERIKELYNNEKWSDIEFIVGKEPNQARFYAHKFILTIGSEVFDTTFNGPLAKKRKQIELPDEDPDGFRNLLLYLYTNNFELNGDNVLSTLYTSKKYYLLYLEKACVNYLKDNINSDNVFIILNKAKLFDEFELVEICLKYIDSTPESFDNSSFLDADEESICEILQRDTLQVREKVLFNSVVKWAKNECKKKAIEDTSENLRKILTNILKLIRFPLMTQEEYATEVAITNILNDRDVIDLFIHFSFNPKLQVKFVNSPRFKIESFEQCINRFTDTRTKWGYHGSTDRIKFMVNRKIFVLGYGLYGSIYEPFDYICNIKLFDNSQSIIADNNTVFYGDGSNKVFRVNFREPVEVNPNVWYTACATLKGQDSYYGTGGKKEVIIETPNKNEKVIFNFLYESHCNNGTSVENGQIPEIYFMFNKKEKKVFNISRD